MKETKENNLLSGSIAPSLMKFAIPVILSMVTAQLYAVVDSMIIGRFLDTAALAAVSNAVTVLMVFLFISGGMELGCGLLIAAKKPVSSRKEMSRLLYNLLFLDLALALIIMTVGLGTFRFFLLKIHTPVEILELAMNYGRTYLFFLPFQMLYDVSREMVIGMGDSRNPLRFAIATTITNVILDLLMVPVWGLSGAAIATGLAEAAGCAGILWLLKKNYLEGSFRLSLLSAEYGREILRLAPPNALQQASGTVVTIVKQSLLGAMGAMAIAGFSCATKTISFLMMPLYGFTQSLVIFYAQNLAVGKTERVREAKRLSRWITGGYVLLVGAAAAILAGPIMHLYTTDAEAIRYGTLIMTFGPIAQFFFGMRLMNEAQLRGRQQMLLYLVSNMGAIGMNILVCLLLVKRLGFSGFYTADIITQLLSILSSAALVELGKKKDLQNDEI